MVIVSSQQHSIEYFCMEQNGTTPVEICSHKLHIADYITGEQKLLYPINTAAMRFHGQMHSILLVGEQRREERNVVGSFSKVLLFRRANELECDPQLVHDNRLVMELLMWIETSGEHMYFEKTGVSHPYRPV